MGCSPKHAGFSTPNSASSPKTAVSQRTILLQFTVLRRLPEDSWNWRRTFCRRQAACYRINLHILASGRAFRVVLAPRKRPPARFTDPVQSRWISSSLQRSKKITQRMPRLRQERLPGSDTTCQNALDVNNIMHPQSQPHSKE